MKERSIVSAIALCTSIGAYYFAKSNQKDTTPLVMLGGFLGALVGEIIVEAHQSNPPKKKNQFNNQNNKQINKQK